MTETGLSESIGTKGPRWNGPCCHSSDGDTSSIHERLGRFLNTVNCLPGTGYLKITVEGAQITGYRLPFPMNFASLSIRKDLLQAMASGGGCEIRLTIPEASGSLLFAVCFRSGRWMGCSAEDVAKELVTHAREIPVGFPAVGSVERLRIANVP